MTREEREEICNSMTVQDAVRVLKETNCYGTMDIAKSVILRALEQEPCEKCCNGNQEEKAKLCQKSYIAGMEHNCENEEIIKVSKGVLKARQGRYVIYDVKWLKEHFNTTEAKIYGQPSEDWNAVLDELNRIGRNAFKDDTDYDNLFDFISNLPNVKPQPSERTEERTETHECDCISRQAVDDAIYDYSRSCDVNYQQIMEFIDKIPPANPQESKTDILDKIEAEIGQAFLDDKAMQEHTVKKCLGIIDKYKGERKG
jgi:hypothetical protein